MASGSLASELIRPRSAVKAETWLRYAAIAFTICAVLGIALHLGTLLWAQQEFTQPESIVAAQSTMLAHEGYLYGSLQDYPYTVNAYMPVFYVLEAAMLRVGIPMPLGGRLISFAALLGILGIVWKLVLLYTRSKQCAWMGILLTGTTSLLLQWGTTGQVDTLAVFLSLTAFYFFSRYWVSNEGTILQAGLCALAGLLVKQTVVAAPAAIFLLLLSRSPQQALRFAAIVAGGLSTIMLAANEITHGGFLTNTLFANINPFAWDKLSQHGNYMLLFAGQLILVVAVCIPRLWSTSARALLLYLGTAASILAITAPKIGSDSNYQIETTILLAVLSAVGLHAVNFFPRFFAGDKALLTLLHLPLGVHMVLNLRLMYPTLLGRIAKEQAFRQQLAELRPLAGDGRAIIADANAALRLKGRMEVEPLIYTILVQGGRIDPEPLRHDLAQEQFSTLVLYTDVNRTRDVDPEIPRLIETQNEEIRRHYKLVKHVPGPYMDGLYVYHPNGSNP